MNKKLLIALLLLGNATLVLNASTSKLEPYKPELEEDGEDGELPELGKIFQSTQENPHNPAERPTSAPLPPSTSPFGLKGSATRSSLARSGAPSFSSPRKYTSSAYEKNKEVLDKQLKELNELLEAIKQVQWCKQSARRPKTPIDTIEDITAKVTIDRNPLLLIDQTTSKYKTVLQEFIQRKCETMKELLKNLTELKVHGVIKNLILSVEDLEGIEKKQKGSQNNCQFAYYLNLMNKQIEAEHTRLSLSMKALKIIKKLSADNHTAFIQALAKINNNPQSATYENSINELILMVTMILRKKNIKSPVSFAIETSPEDSSREPSPRITPYPYDEHARSVSAPTVFTPRRIASPAGCDFGVVSEQTKEYEEDPKDLEVMHGTHRRDLQTGQVTPERLTWHEKHFGEEDPEGKFFFAAQQEELATRKDDDDSDDDNAASGVS